MARSREGGAAVKRTGRRSDCPINFALQTFGDGWSLLIIRDLMFTERRTYGDFLGAEEGIATNVLADRLKHLQAQGLIRKRGSGRRDRPPASSAPDSWASISAKKIF